MKFLGGICLFLFLSLSAFGQRNFSLSGNLIDKLEETPVIGGSVELLNAKDSTFVSGTVSNTNGQFSIGNLSAGDYLIRISSIGYNAIRRNVTLSETNTSVNLGKLYLEMNEFLLSEAIIQGKVPEMIVKNDTIEYDAGSFKVTENAVVEDLLKTLPGVEVDKDGKITVNGKEVKKILVDNKEFFDDDPQIASKNLPAEMVDKLQVVDRRSEMSRMTGFDDGEEETIINLTIRPGMKRGTMGNAFVGMGQDLGKSDDTRYQAAGFLNRMQDNDQYTLIVGRNNNNNMGASDLGANQFGGGRMRRGSGGITETTNVMLRMNKELSPAASLNGDVRYTGSDRLSTSKTERTTLSKTNSRLDKATAHNNYTSNSVATNFRFDWKPDTLNTLVFRPTFSFNNSKSTEISTSNRFNFDTEELILKEDEDSKSKGNGYNVTGNLTFAHKFKSNIRRVFSLEARGSYNESYSTEKNWNITSRPNVPDSIRIRRFEDDPISKSFRGVVSWTEPVGTNNFIQATYRLSYSNSENKSSSYDIWDDIADFDPVLAASIIQTDPMATLILDQSRSTLREVINQRIGVNFKAVREKYNYTIGFNIDPFNSINETFQPTSDKVVPIYYYSDKRLPNVMGDSLFNSIKQNVVNFSPVVNFNYLFGRRSNLRIDYEGETSQPSANQLRDFVDQSRPNNWVGGNPNLKPGYSNSLRLRFQKYVESTQLMYNISLNGGFSINDVTSKVTDMDNGVRLTGYENVNGNWNTNFRSGFNMPLRNKKFTIGGNLMTNFRNQNSFDRDLEITMKNLQSRIDANANYRSSLFDLGIRTNFNYSNIAYSIQTRKDQSTFSYGVSGYTTWYLPNNFVIESDINWTDRSGYAAGYNIAEVMWNMSASKQVFNKSYGTGTVKVQVYDIFQDRNSISASYTDNGYRSSESNVIPSFFMCSFIYKFTSFGGSSRRGNREGGERIEGERRREERMIFPGGGGNFRGGGQDGPSMF